MMLVLNMTLKNGRLFFPCEIIIVIITDEKTVCFFHHTNMIIIITKTLNTCHDQQPPQQSINRWSCCFHEKKITTFKNLPLKKVNKVFLVKSKCKQNTHAKLQWNNGFETFTNKCLLPQSNYFFPRGIISHKTLKVKSWPPRFFLLLLCLHSNSHHHWWHWKLSNSEELCLHKVSTYLLVVGRRRFGSWRCSRWSAPLNLLGWFFPMLVW